MEAKIAHLELIQGIINRLANNSFLIKGWVVTIVVGLFALAGLNSDRKYLLIAYLPVIAFWLLDTYYLCLERRYVELYERARKEGDNEVNFDLSITNFKNNANSFPVVLFSKTIALFHGPILLALIVITFLLNR